MNYKCLLRFKQLFSGCRPTIFPVFYLCRKRPVILAFFLFLFSFCLNAQTSVFDVAGGGALPSGWVGNNNVTTSAISQTGYFLLEAGTSSDNIVTSAYDLTGYQSVVFTVNYAFNGTTGTIFPVNIQVSYDGGTTYTQLNITNLPGSATLYQSSGPITLNSTFTNNVKIRIANNGTAAGRGVKLQAIKLTGYGKGWQTGGNQETAIKNFGTANNFDLPFITNNAEKLRITSAGNVGVGVTAPAEKLDVAGNFKFTGALMPNNLPGTAGYVLTSAGPGVAPTWNMPSGGSAAPGGVNTQLQYNNNGTFGGITGAETDGTKIGINGAAVGGIEGYTPFSVTASSFGNQPGIDIVKPSAGLMLRMLNGSASASVLLGAYGNGNNSGFIQMNNGAVNAISELNNLQIGITGHTPVITATADRVGIGTTTPSANAKLDVNGNVQVVGKITSPGAGNASEKFGYDASVGANNYSVAVGNIAATTGHESVAIGYNARAAFNSVAAGSNAQATGFASTVIGLGGNDGGNNYITSVGAAISNPGYFSGGSYLNSGVINIGYNNIATGHNHTYLIGANLTADRANQMLIGNGLAGGFVLDMVLGGGLSNPLASNYGPLSVRTTDGNGANSAGMSLALKGGKSTGSAAGGSISFFTSPAGTAGSTLNTEMERFRIDANGAISVNGVAGTAGQVLTSAGPGAPPTWQTSLGGGGGVSQWTTTGNDIFNNNTGNVSVGTSVIYQNFKLVSMGSSGVGGLLVSGGSSEGHNWASGQVRLGHHTDYGSLVYDGYDGTVTLSNFYDNSNGNILFKTRRNGAGITAMNISGDGNVGIGVITPRTKLDVGGAIIAGGDKTAYSILQTDNNNFPSVNTNINGLKIGAAGSDVVFISPTGNVGIGTQTPASNLHVVGNTGVKVINPATGSSESSSIVVGNSLGADQSMALYYGNNGNAIWGPLTANLLANVGTTGGMNISVAANAPLNFGTNNTTRMSISATGHVGIGVANTFAEYKLAVAGAIIAEKVKVKLQSNGWPDYVFQPDYKLPSLQYVETFIKANNHLPEVPSADEVKKNGIDLGDNQAVLLKKIEELTLYIIEQNKKSAQQQQQMNKLQQQLDTLSTLLKKSKQ